MNTEQLNTSNTDAGSQANAAHTAIDLSYLQLAFERTYKGDVGKGNTALFGAAHQFGKRKNGTYQSDRLQNIFQGFCLALQSINDSSISFSDLKTGNA